MPAGRRLTRRGSSVPQRLIAAEEGVMPMWLPVVARTARFDSSLPGEQLIGLVEKESTVAVTHRLDEHRVETGQCSCYPCRNLRVCATLESPYLDPTEQYESCLVETHLWSPPRFRLGYDYDVPVHDLEDFTRRLERAVREALRAPDPVAQDHRELWLPGAALN